MKKLWEISGVNFFEKWILPTNSESKNPVWKKINQIVGLNHGIKNRPLELRLLEAYGLSITHSALFIWIVSLRLPADGFILLGILGNIYPTLVQVKTATRIHAILKHKHIKVSNSSTSLAQKEEG